MSAFQVLQQTSFKLLLVIKISFSMRCFITYSKCPIQISLKQAGYYTILILFILPTFIKIAHRRAAGCDKFKHKNFEILGKNNK